ncbi:sigma-54-dependent transcriptional regulator [Thermophagus sp. OGC60D27]|uniref:sigma-54-dependent transcriptional regulator n=1 Tax=Thermophagus sp. OGC60D27 TaxID=3458415 RepID=UPI004037EA59
MRVDIIEDDPVFNRIIEEIITKSGNHEINTYFNAISFLNQRSPSPDIVTLDLGLPDIHGSELMKKIKNLYPETEVIIISGQNKISLAVQLLKEGAYDYIAKDENIKERLLHTLKKIEDHQRLKQELIDLKTEIAVRYQFQQTIIGNSKNIKNSFPLIEKAIKVPNINVSLHGEGGTGKSLTAKIIHYNSQRKNHPFVSLNVTPKMNDQLKSLLLGIEKNDSEGNTKIIQGKIEEAGEGTLFIDEIAFLNPEIQSLLLNILQDRRITRIGGKKEIPVKCRFISATCFDLLKEVKEQKFREDLYYHLIGLPISLPPLRERGNDIILLASEFLKVFCQENGLPASSLTPTAKKKLLSHSFPGNIRELKAVIELSAVLSNDGIIDEKHIIFNASEPAPALFHEELTLKEYNERIILYFLGKYKNVMTVAKKLNIGKSTIYNLLKSKHSEIQ